MSFWTTITIIITIFESRFMWISDRKCSKKYKLLTSNHEIYMKIYGLRLVFFGTFSVRNTIVFRVYFFQIRLESCVRILIKIWLKFDTFAIENQSTFNFNLILKSIWIRPYNLWYPKQLYRKFKNRWRSEFLLIQIIESWQKKYNRILFTKKYSNFSNPVIWIHVSNVVKSSYAKDIRINSPHLKHVFI